MKKVWAWLLVILSYLFTFVTPMVAAYYLLAEQQDQTTGGLFFYIVIGIFGGALVIALTKVINKQKANAFKTVFRLSIKGGLLFGLISLVRYIDFNIDNLLLVLYIASAGFFVGSLFEMIAVLKYKDYIREVGVF